MRKTTKKKNADSPAIKGIDELGISPCPWTAESGPLASIVFAATQTADRESVCASTGETRREDAALIAAAPVLYANLHEAVYEFCHACAARKGDGIGTCDQTDGRCYVQRWRATLAKAGAVDGGAK